MKKNHPQTCAIPIYRIGLGAKTAAIKMFSQWCLYYQIWITKKIESASLFDTNWYICRIVEEGAKTAATQTLSRLYLILPDLDHEKKMESTILWYKLIYIIYAGSDKKKLKQQLQKCFPALTETDLNRLIPTKDEIITRKWHIKKKKCKENASNRCLSSLNWWNNP